MPAKKNAQHNQKHVGKHGRYAVDKELKKALELAGRTIVDQLANGNCLFYAFAHQHCGNSKKHMVYRKRAAEYVDTYPEAVLESFSQDVVGMPWEDWRQKVRDQHVFGDEYVLRILCTIFNVKARVHRLREDPIEFIQGFGCPTNETKVIELSFHGSEESGHYNSVLVNGMRPFDVSHEILMDEPNEPALWNCPQCTFENHPALSCCELCYAAKPYMKNCNRSHNQNYDDSQVTIRPCRTATCGYAKVGAIGVISSLSLYLIVSYFWFVAHPY
jgi:hypothetical protein